MRTKRFAFVVLPAHPSYSGSPVFTKLGATTQNTRSAVASRSRRAVMQRIPSSLPAVPQASSGLTSRCTRQKARPLPTTSVRRPAQAFTDYTWPERIAPPPLEGVSKDHEAVLREVRELLSERVAMSSLFFSACDTNENGQIEYAPHCLSNSWMSRHALFREPRVGQHTA